MHYSIRQNFNPRLREGGDALAQSHPLRISGFQSTPPRRRRRDLELHASIWFTISIHASAKEATSGKASCTAGIEFQSTPPRRRRRSPVGQSGTDFLYFNPRLREGGDQCHTFLAPLSRTISIHASAKEATKPRFIINYLGSFQSTPPRRRRRL